jgi:hypothetical protein
MSEGELQAAEKLSQAARLIGAEPAALQLRLYQTLVEVSGERNNTIVLPVPIELLHSPGGGGAALVGGAVAAAVSAGKDKAPAPAVGEGAERTRRQLSEGQPPLGITPVLDDLKLPR